MRQCDTHIKKDIHVYTDTLEFVCSERYGNTLRDIDKRTMFAVSDQYMHNHVSLLTQLTLMPKTNCRYAHHCARHFLSSVSLHENMFSFNKARSKSQNY